MQLASDKFQSHLEPGAPSFPRCERRECAKKHGDDFYSPATTTVTMFSSVTWRAKAALTSLALTFSMFSA